MKSYNLFDIQESSTILYHAIASSEDQVRELANEANIDIDGLTIEVERFNVTDELGRPMKPVIKDALIR